MRDLPKLGRQPKGRGTPTYNLAKFSRKLYEIERKLGREEGEEGARPKFYYVDLKLVTKSIYPNVSAM